MFGISSHFAIGERQNVDESQTLWMPAWYSALELPKVKSRKKSCPTNLYHADFNRFWTENAFKNMAKEVISTSCHKKPTKNYDIIICK